jgi:hypothetical protein
MTKIHIAAAIAILFTAVGGSTFAASDPVPAPSQQPAPSVAPAMPAAAPQPPKKSRDDEMVCKTEETTGSRLGGKKVCMTRRDWAQHSLDDEEMLLNGNPYDVNHH